MANGNNYTVKEHYVPQVYLRLFSQDQKNIYRFDVKREQANLKQIPIKSVVYKENLYESKDASGNYNFQNYIENHLCQWEEIFGRKSRALLSAVRNNPYESFDNLLDDESIAFWLFYISIQLLRVPSTIEAAENSIIKYIDSTVSKEDAHTHILSQSFPFFSDSNVDQDTIFNAFTKPLFKMNFYLGIDLSRRLWTSDHPVCGSAKNFMKNGYDTIFFPLAPDLAVILTSTKTVVEIQKYEQHLLTADQVDIINSNIVFQARECIFSATPFSPLAVLQMKAILHGEQTRSFHKRK